MGLQQPVGQEPESDEIEQLKRLIEIQAQIVELAKQNEIAQKECEALWRELSRDARQGARRSFLRRPSRPGAHAVFSAAPGDPAPWRRLYRRAADAVYELGAWVLPRKLGS